MAEPLTNRLMALVASRETKGVAWLSSDQIRRELNCSRMALKRARDSLVSLNCLRWHRVSRNGSQGDLYSTTASVTLLAHMANALSVTGCSARNHDSRNECNYTRPTRYGFRNHKIVRKVQVQP